MAEEDVEPTSPEEERRPPGRVGRRGFLKGIGASALATAAVVFGAGRAAHAYTVGCCHLWNPPSSWTNCAGKADRYIWTCYVRTSPTCDRPYQCCEAGKKPYGGWTWSAYRVIAGCV